MDSTVGNLFTLAQTRQSDWSGSARPVDIRYINPPTERGISVSESQLMWMRIAFWASVTIVNAQRIF